MLDLTPIREFLLDRDKLMCGADELGYVSSNGENLLSFAETVTAVEQAINNSSIAALLVEPELELNLALGETKLFRCLRPRDAFFTLHNSLPESNEIADSKIHPSSHIHSQAFVDSKGVIIGADVLIEPNVVIHAGCSIGNNTIIRAGAVIGSPALEIRVSKSGELWTCAHKGSVVIGSDVEIGPNTVVDRALFRHDLTVIGDQTKVACLCNISHGVKIGKRNILASGVRVSGSTRIGDSNWFGPNSTVSHNLRIGSNCYVSLGSQVMKDMQDGWMTVGSKLFRDRKLF